MKKIVLAVLFLFLVSSVGFASPLMDYEKGKVSFDYTYRPSLDIKGSAEVKGFGFKAAKLADDDDESFCHSFSSGNLDGKANADWGLTIGLGKDFAFQYRQYNPETDRYTFNPIRPLSISLKGKIKSEEYNVLYKLDKKVSAFVGVVRANTSINVSGKYAGVNVNTLPEVKTPDKNMFQVGLLGSTQIADKTNAYGLVSVGKDYRNWEAGLSYEIGKDVEFNVSYRNTKFDKFKVFNIDVPNIPRYAKNGDDESDNLAHIEGNLKDLEVKGWGFGLTYKF